MNYVSDTKNAFWTHVLIDTQYPKLCREEVSITLVQSREHILNTVSPALGNAKMTRIKHHNTQYSEAISKYAEVGQYGSFLTG